MRRRTIEICLWAIVIAWLACLCGSAKAQMIDPAQMPATMQKGYAESKNLSACQSYSEAKKLLDKCDDYWHTLYYDCGLPAADLDQIKDKYHWWGLLKINDGNAFYGAGVQLQGQGNSAFYSGSYPVAASKYGLAVQQFGYAITAYTQAQNYLNYAAMQYWNLASQQGIVP